MANEKILFVDCIMGVFAFDERNKIIDVALFPKNVEEIVKAVEKLQRGEDLNQVFNLVKKLTKKEAPAQSFIFENDRLAKAVEKSFGVEVSVERPSTAGEYLRSSFGKLAVECGFVSSLKEFYLLIHDVSTVMARKGVKEASERRDLSVLQAIFIIDDLDKAFNLFSNRLREWYGYHFPELGRLVNKSDIYVQLIVSLGERRNFTLENLSKMGLSAQRAEAISKAAESSIGSDMSEKEINEIHCFSQTPLNLHTSKDRLEQYLDELMKEVAPNIRELIGSTLGARLIAAVGGLANLSKKSSGAIQVLGAEKALFRSLKTGTRPPKHGLIFQDKIVHQSPRRQRGKIARALAGKIAIAARLDSYGGEYRGDKLKQELDKRIMEIKVKYDNMAKKGKK